jgi:triosephosphate isomerase (TIM)
MNTSLQEAIALVEAMKPGLQGIQGVEKVVCPPFISLAAVRELIRGTDIQSGAQNMYFAEKGAYTGEVSPLMLQGLVDYVILGHSERRQYFGETDETVAKKVKSAQEHGLKPIMCVGETLAEYEAGKSEEVVTRQVRGGLAGLQQLGSLVIAYEPIWAIGTGRAATAQGANQVIGTIRGVVRTLFGDSAADALRIQYGGSVTPDNVKELMEQPEIDGGLVGGASLKADGFVEIVRQSAAAKP